jgi:hypothetical protein
LQSSKSLRSQNSLLSSRLTGAVVVKSDEKMFISKYLHFNKKQHSRAARNMSIIAQLKVASEIEK